MHIDSFQPTGFPSPAADYLEAPLDLQKMLVWRPASTFLFTAGTDFASANIVRNDLLVVDRACPFLHNTIVIAALDGKLCLRRLLRQGKALSLVGADGAASMPTQDTAVWGTVTAIVHRLVLPTAPTRFGK